MKEKRVPDVRPVTEDEIEQFSENGWALLRRLIPSGFAGELLKLAQEKMGHDGAQHEDRPGVDLSSSLFQTYYGPDKDYEEFRRLRLNRELGKNGARLMGREMAMRSLTNSVAAKLPRDMNTDRPGKGETLEHQDFPSTPIWGNAIAFWIALDEITPDMGPMKFRSGANKLGLVLPYIQNWKPDDWPRLRKYPLSEPPHLLPGDATVHSSFIPHCTTENMSDRTRWSYIVNLYPADAPYLGLKGHYHTSDIEQELEIGKPLAHPKFPLVYDPDN